MPFQMREGTQQNAIDRVKCTELLQLAQKSNHLGLQTAAGFQKQNFSLQVWKISGIGKLEQTTDVAAHNDAFHLIPLYKGIGEGKQGIPLFRLIMADLIQHAGIAGHGIDSIEHTGQVAVAPEWFPAAGNGGIIKIRENFIGNISAGSVKDSIGLRIEIEGHQILGTLLC